MWSITQVEQSVAQETHGVNELQSFSGSCALECCVWGGGGEMGSLSRGRILGKPVEEAGDN